MRSLQLVNGDIKLGSNNQAQFVIGKAKLVQDLTLWLQEPLGTGYTTPNFGSILETYIGTTDPKLQSTLVQAEVQRILGLYMNQQKQVLKQLQTRGELSNYNKSEIINSIQGINTTVGVNSITLTVYIRTLASTNITIDMFVSTNGVQVTQGNV